MRTQPGHDSFHVQVVRVAGIAMKRPGMCKLSKVNVMQCDNAENFLVVEHVIGHFSSIGLQYY